MKKFLTLTFLTFSTFAFAQNSKPVDSKNHIGYQGESGSYAGMNLPEKI